MTEKSPLKLLCVTAHPDDECFGFGGALMLAAERGIETSVLCFTDGQAATNRGASTSPEELGRMRRAEFAASCAILGVTHYELLDYQDGKYRFTEITVHPQVAVKSQDDVERARQIMESAHANCFISNSITASVNVIPEFRVMD